MCTEFFLVFFYFFASLFLNILLFSFLQSNRKKVFFLQKWKKLGKFSKKNDLEQIAPFFFFKNKTKDKFLEFFESKKINSDDLFLVGKFYSFLSKNIQVQKEKNYFFQLLETHYFDSSL